MAASILEVGNVIVSRLFFFFLLLFMMQTFHDVNVVEIPDWARDKDAQ